MVSLDELMETADFISIHCPLNDATRGLIGAEQLGKVKRGSYLINTARGGIVDEAALAEVRKLSCHFFKKSLFRFSHNSQLHTTPTRAVACVLRRSYAHRVLIGAGWCWLVHPTAFTKYFFLEALKSGKLAGAALDCFEAEPVLEPNTALTKFPGLISAPHCIGWTAELFRDIGSCACASLVTFVRQLRHHSFKSYLHTTHATPHAPCDMLCLGPMPIEC